MAANPLRRRAAAALVALLAGATGPAVAGSPAPALTSEPSAAVTAAGAPRYRIPRARSDRRDVVRGPQVHVVYLIAADSRDDRLDERGVLETSVRAQSAWLRAQTGRDWNWDVFRTSAVVGGRRRTVTALDVTFVRSQRSEEELVSNHPSLRPDLERAGLDRADKRYLVYAAVGADSTGRCGIGQFPSFAGGSDPNTVGRYAYVFLDASSGCRSRDFAASEARGSYSEVIAQQELMHNDGAVPASAPHTCAVSPFHVCTGPLVYFAGLDPERTDIMYPFISVPLAEKQVDRNRDDYYGERAVFRDLAKSPYLVARSALS